MNLATWNEDEASRHVLGQLITVIDSVRTRAIRSKPGPFRKADPIPVFNPLSLQERHARIEADLEALVAEHPDLRDFASSARALLGRVSTSSVREAPQAVMDLADQWLEEGAETAPEGGGLEAEPMDLEAVAALIDEVRREQRPPTRRERLAITRAHEALASGARVTLPFKPLPMPGFGEVQTLMSVTDPGEGHLSGTTTREDFLRGVIVHVEHLERGHKDRESVEPYRIPRVLSVAKTRLHVGARAPVTSFIGRPMFDGGRFELDLWKVVQTMSAACTAMFQLGVAECKVAMDRMTASQIIELMRCLRGNVMRDPRTQLLSAAFNLNTPILDDRGGGSRQVTDRREIGLLAIELVVAGGFDKVTWDGSADTYPSVPIMEQISHATALELVHRAHERGLRTYFSAGFRFPHIAAAVHTGVDGVGIGGAQILRYMDSETGYHGPFKPENLPRILALRDEAARDPLGRAAALLARLDWLSSKGQLDERQEALRNGLYQALSRKQVDAFLDELSLRPTG